MINNNVEQNVNINTNNILYDIDIIKNINFVNNKIVIAPFIEQIILEYYFKEIFNPILFNYEKNLLRNKNSNRKVIDNKIKNLITNHSQNIFFDFFDKFIIKNILNLTKDFSEYRIFEGKEEIISVMFFNIFNVTNDGILDINEKKKLKKTIKQMNDFLEKKINKLI